MSQSRIWPSLPALTRVRPSGLASTLETEPSCAAKAGPSGRRSRAVNDSYAAVLAAGEQVAAVAREARERGVAFVDAQTCEASARAHVEDVDRAGGQRHGDSPCRPGRCSRRWPAGLPRRIGGPSARAVRASHSRSVPSSPVLAMTAPFRARRRREDEVAMSAQSGDDATRVGVDEREEAVHAADDEPCRADRTPVRRPRAAGGTAGAPRMGRLWRVRVERSTRLTAPRSCTVASERPSPLMAVDGNQSPLPVPAWNVRPSRRSPARSHAMTLPSRPAV